MFNKEENIKDEIILMTLSEIVPKDHFLRKVDKAINFKFIYDLTEQYYSHTSGRNSLDPVVLFKLVFLKDFYGIKSMRETIKRIETDAAFRWFLGIPFTKPAPHYSTFSQNYIRRFQGTDVFEQIFINIVNQAIEKKLVGGNEFFTDSTHIKANANKKKFKTEVTRKIKARKLDLEKEINEERKKIGKKPFEYKDKEETKKQRINTTDPDSGYYHRDYKEEGFMYLDHRTVDGKNNIIMDCHITPGNVHDSVGYIGRIDEIEKNFGLIPSKVALDSGYYSLDILKQLEKRCIFSVIGYRRFPKSKDKKYFKYLYEKDIFVDTRTGEIFEYKNIDRKGYKEYRSADKKEKKKIRRHIDADYYEKARLRRISKEGRILYKKRKETIERSFADSKQNHGYRYAQYRGKAKVQSYAWLSCCVQNMKTVALREG